ncbi:MAG: right-handed parallel beta-helix repeat-containing protein [Candidatus Eisenbacteria bacterium]|nr:right-handed parallel beta-helix repeat-containing protein [Candidatus Eisenbacteria bacterium]
MSLAAEGDTVAVAEGVYRENLIIEKSLVLTGGWDRDFSGRDPVRRPTVLDGLGVEKSVVVARGEGVSFVLDGFTVRNGWVDGNGGGVSIHNGVEAVLRGNRIVDNYARYHGGGVCAANKCSLTAEANIFENNSVVFHGGGLCLLDRTRGTVRGNLFRGNRVISDSGGGLAVLRKCAAEVIGNRFEENRAMKRGGAVSFLQSNEARVRGNLAIGNDCGDMGGALYSWKNDVLFERNTLVRNYGPLTGGIRIDNRGSARLVRNLLVRSAGAWLFVDGGSEPVSEGNVLHACGPAEGVEPWAGARREDPLLCDEATDPRLRPASPVRGEGAAGCYTALCGEEPAADEPPLFGERR